MKNNTISFSHLLNGFLFIILIWLMGFSAKADTHNYMGNYLSLNMNNELEQRKPSVDSSFCKIPYNENASSSNVFFSHIHIDGIGAAQGDTDFDLIYNSDEISSYGYAEIDEPVLMVYSGMESAYTLRSGPTDNTDKYYYSLWVDLNDDGCFDEDEQIIWSNSASGGIANDVAGVINIDLDESQLGYFRARIRNSKTGHPSSEGEGDGEALDFTIKVVTEEEANMILKVEDQIFRDFTYYPNPVEERLNLKAATPIEQVEVYNLLGERVIHKQLNGLNAKMMTDHLHSGIYFMKVTIEGNQKTFKIVKK